MKNSFRSSFRKFDRSIAKQEQEISGELGIYLGGEQLVDVPRRPGFVYVRLRNNLSEVIEAFNETVSVVYGLAVIVVRQGNRYVVKGRDTERYNNWGSASSFLPNHGNQHSFNPEGGGGGDITFVYGQQFMPLNAVPSGTAGSDSVVVSQYQYRKSDGTIINIGATGTENLVQYKPTNDEASMGIIYVDPEVGNPEFIMNSGTTFSADITGTMEVVPYYPAIADESLLLVYGIRLVSGTSIVSWDNMYDLRQLMTLRSTGSAGGGGGGENYYDGYGVAIQEDGVFVVSGTAINFVGDNVDVSASGTIARVFVTGSIGGGGSETTYIGFYDDDVFVASGTQVSFNTNLTVTESGGRVQVEAPVTTYQRVGAPTQIGGVTGTVWQVPDGVYASGSLAVFYDGLIQYLGTHYEELIYVSGTYQYLFTPETGTNHMVMYGVPCSVQTYSTGTDVSEFALTDSDGELLLDSDSEQLLDSDG